MMMFSPVDIELALPDDMMPPPTVITLSTVDLGRGQRIHTSALHHERNDIAQDKYLGQPLASDDRVNLTVREQDQSSEFHVDTGREQRWGNEKKHRLLDIWS